jgi:hypothetical protein
MYAEVSDPVGRQVDVYNCRDVDAFLACYSPDTVIEDALGNVVLRGQDAMRAVYEELFRDSPALHAEITTRIRVGEYAIDEEVVTGRRGSREEMRVAVIYHVAGDLIDHVRLIR